MLRKNSERDNSFVRNYESGGVSKSKKNNGKPKGFFILARNTKCFAAREFLPRKNSQRQDIRQNIKPENSFCKKTMEGRQHFFAKRNAAKAAEFLKVRKIMVIRKAFLF